MIRFIKTLSLVLLFIMLWFATSLFWVLFVDRPLKQRYELVLRENTKLRAQLISWERPDSLKTYMDFMLISQAKRIAEHEKRIQKLEKGKQ